MEWSSRASQIYLDKQLSKMWIRIVEEEMLTHTLSSSLYEMFTQLNNLITSNHLHSIKFTYSMVVGS